MAIDVGDAIQVKPRKPMGIKPRDTSVISPEEKAAAAAAIDLPISVEARESVTGRAARPSKGEQRKTLILIPESVYQQLKDKTTVKNGPTLRSEILRGLRAIGYVVPESELIDGRSMR